MQNPNTYQVQFLQLFTNLYAKFQPSSQFNFQTSPVMYSEAKAKTFASPESVISVEVLTDCASATLTSPSLTSRTEERDSFENEKPFEISDFEEAIQAVQDSLDKETNEPSKILKRSKKIVKEEVRRRNVDQNLSKEKKESHRSKKNSWKKEEDLQLCKLFEQYGQQWTKIGTMMGNKTGKQVRDRYRNKLRPDINYTEWTEEEDKLFLSLVSKYGNKWCKIASKMPGRTENQVKNKFYCLGRDRKKSNERRNALINAIQGIENTDTNDTNTGSISSEPKSQEHDPVVYYDVDEYFEFNQPAHWNDEICFENKVQEGELDYIPQPFKHILLQNNNLEVFFG